MLLSNGEFLPIDKHTRVAGKSRSITLVNTQFGASSIKTVLGYIWGADSKNDIGFFASALVFELRHTPIILTFICYTWILSNKQFV